MSNPQQQYPQYPGGHGHVQQQGHAAQPPRNGLGTAALVLGIVGFVLSLIPFIGFIGFICALVGVCLGIGGVVRAGKGGATNRTTAIIGTLLSAIAAIVSIMVFVSAANALSAAVAPGTVTAATGGPAAASGQAPAQTRFTAGDTADVEGLQITSSPLRKKSQSFGSALLCTDVRYVNGTNDSVRFNGYGDWKLQNPNGTIKDPTLAVDVKGLDSGELVPGGTTDGTVCFEDPKLKGDYLVIHETLFSLDRTKVEWATKV